MKKLFKIKNSDSIIGGVCLGLSEYFKIDVTVIRILFLIGLVTPVPAVIPYLILWAIMPKKNEYSI